MKVFFVSGVSGVGKSTLIPYLRQLLPADRYAVHDFDIRGVPDGADERWRRAEIAYWLEESATAARLGKDTIICGFVELGDFAQFAQSQIANVEILVLHADAETIRQRLIKRYSRDGVFDPNQTVIGMPVNRFIAFSMSHAEKMRDECAAAGFEVVDTSIMSANEVAKKVAAVIGQPG